MALLQSIHCFLHSAGGGGPHSIGYTANSQEKSIIRIGLWRERDEMNSLSLQAGSVERGNTQANPHNPEWTYCLFY